MERYHTKRKGWSGIKIFWTIQNSYPVSCTINKLNKLKAAKSDFSTLCTKISHDKLQYVLNEITGFTFKGGARDYVTDSGAFWSPSNNKTGRSYSLQEIISNRFFQVGSPFFANVFLFFYECKWLKSVKNTNYLVVSKPGKISRFIDDLRIQ